MKWDVRSFNNNYKNRTQRPLLDFLKGPTVYTHIQRFRNVEKWKDEEKIQQTN